MSRWLLVAGFALSLCLVAGLLVANFVGGEAKIERRIERPRALARHTLRSGRTGRRAEAVGLHRQLDEGHGRCFAWPALLSRIASRRRELGPDVQQFTQRWQ